MLKSHRKRITGIWPLLQVLSLHWAAPARSVLPSLLSPAGSSIWLEHRVIFIYFFTQGLQRQSWIFPEMDPCHSREKVWLLVWVKAQKPCYLMNPIQTSGVRVNRNFQPFKKISIIFFLHLAWKYCQQITYYAVLNALSCTNPGCKNMEKQHTTVSECSYFMSLHLWTSALRASCHTI